MRVDEIDVAQYREPEYGIEPIFTRRWSPRAMSGEAISDQQLMALFEAARWAPSSYNGQPWRFLYAKRDSEHWPTFFELLVEFNQGWARQAAALIVILSRNTFEWNGEPAITHSFDCGAAWQNLALQGAHMGLVVHGMQGFDYERARSVLKVPEHFTVEAMAAVGKPGDPDQLHADLQSREHPSDRKPISEFVCEGRFEP